MQYVKCLAAHDCFYSRQYLVAIRNAGSSSFESEDGRASFTVSRGRRFQYKVKFRLSSHPSTPFSPTTKISPPSSPSPLAQPRAPLSAIIVSPPRSQQHAVPQPTTHTCTYTLILRGGTKIRASAESVVFTRRREPGAAAAAAESTLYTRRRRRCSGGERPDSRFPTEKILTP